MWFGYSPQIYFYYYLCNLKLVIFGHFPNESEVPVWGIVFHKHILVVFFFLFTLHWPFDNPIYNCEQCKNDGGLKLLNPNRMLLHRSHFWYYFGNYHHCILYISFLAMLINFCIALKRHSSQRSGKGAIIKKLPLQKPRWEQIKPYRENTPQTERADTRGHPASRKLKLRKPTEAQKFDSKT